MYIYIYLHFELLQFLVLISSVCVYTIQLCVFHIFCLYIDFEIVKVILHFYNLVQCLIYKEYTFAFLSHRDFQFGLATNKKETNVMYNIKTYNIKSI